AFAPTTFRARAAGRCPTLSSSSSTTPGYFASEWGKSLAPMRLFLPRAAGMRRAGADAVEQLVDDAGVLRVRVGEVARPDEVVLAGQVGHGSHRALAGVEADDALAAEVLARLERQLLRERPVVRLEELVE